MPYYILFFLFPCLAWAETVLVTHVIDGDTFVIDDGSHVRLLGINAPERAKPPAPSQPGAAAATAATQALLQGKQVTLEFGPTRKDRYKRLLAHVYLTDGTWVNGTLVEQGLVHVYSFPDNRSKTADLLALENQARQTKLGLWALPEWQTWQSDSTFPDQVIGRFQLVEGTVTHTAQLKDVTYLNFGEDWRTDFTVEIRAKDLPLFAQAGINPKQDYMGKKLRVRGILKPVNGVLITATHPEQLEILQ